MSDPLDIIMPDLPEGWAWQPSASPEGEHEHQLFDVSESHKPLLVATMGLHGTGKNVRYMRVDELDGAVWTHPSLTDAAKWAMTKWGGRDE